MLDLTTIEESGLDLVGAGFDAGIHLGEFIERWRRGLVFAVYTRHFCPARRRGGAMSDRREFFRQAAAATGSLAASTVAVSARQRAGSMPTAPARALMGLFGLSYPILCAGMGGTATPELAIAVSNAGGLGAIGTDAGLSADVLRERVSRIRSGTGRQFAVNYLLAFEPATVPIALDAGAPIIQFAWGYPLNGHRPSAFNLLTGSLTRPTGLQPRCYLPTQEGKDGYSEEE